MIETIIGAVGLAYLSIEDIRRKELHTLPILIFGVIGIVALAVGGEWQDWGILWRFLPGLMCLGFGKISGEVIGYGDGLVILCLGCYLTITQLLELCFAAVTLAGIAALFLLLLFHKGKKTTIPLVPFLLAGYVIIILV